MDLELAGLCAVITGATRGLGWATAQRLLQEGARVAICGRDPAEVRRCRAEAGSGAALLAYEADVTEKHALDAFVEEAAGALGAIDLVVANAGGSVAGAPLDEEVWRGAFDLNVAHPVGVLRTALPHLRKSCSGSVVVVSSISGHRPDPALAYAAAKAAASSLARTLSWALASDRIRMNVVAPGSLESDSWRRFAARRPDDFAAFRQRELPWKRLGTEDEVADAICFLLSRRASWINGAIVPVDGGQGRSHARSFDGLLDGD